MSTAIWEEVEGNVLHLQTCLCVSYAVKFSKIALFLCDINKLVINGLLTYLVVTLEDSLILKHLKTTHFFDI